VGSEDLSEISGGSVAGGTGSSFCTCGVCGSDRVASIGSSFIGAGAGVGDSALGSAGLGGVVRSVGRLIGLRDLSLGCRLLYGDLERGLAVIE